MSTYIFVYFLDTFVNALHCDGVVTDYQTFPAGVCTETGTVNGGVTVSLMYECINGRMTQEYWLGSNNCSGNPSHIQYNFCDSLSQGL